MKANESHKHCQKRLHFFRAAYLAVKSYSSNYNERNPGQFTCGFTDNSTYRETNAKDSFTGVSCMVSITIRKWTQTLSLIVKLANL